MKGWGWDFNPGNLCPEGMLTHCAMLLSVEDLLKYLQAWGVTNCRNYLLHSCLFCCAGISSIDLKSSSLVFPPTESSGIIRMFNLYIAKNLFLGILRFVLQDLIHMLLLCKVFGSDS